jgi:gamma-glutamyl:cysteine ligase YbdK (ATP-grasp superfamily)
MGIAVDREEFTREDYAAFSERLAQDLEILRALLARPGFGIGPETIGAEVEMHLVDAAAQPALVNAQVLKAANDERCTLETDAFNFEINADPVELAGRPFSALGRQFAELLALVRRAAADRGARVVLSGTLPTLTLAHLQAGVLSDAARYRAMSRELRERRGEPFAVHIEGRESLRAECDDIALEGANASLQVHLRVAPQQFAAVYNAAQLAAAPLLAVSGNSPFLDAKCLWEESRIAVFKQSVDTRLDERERTRAPSRVTFGHGWVHDPFALFAENVALHEPLLPVLPEAHAQAEGDAPPLDALRLHHGTVWSWNRAVFDPHGGGHLRVEHRVVASGPTVIDMLANAAFTLGLTLGLAPRMGELLPALPFAFAERNMYRAAKYGLDAELAWPAKLAPSPRTRPARALVLELLPLAEAALIAHGVAPEEASDLLAIIQARAISGRTGAAFQRALVARHERGLGREQALVRMLEAYLQLSATERPVHEWPLDP